jgi:hypothetical protein
LEVKKNYQLNTNHLYVPFAIIDNDNIGKNITNTNSKGHKTNKYLEDFTIDHNPEQTRGEKKKKPKPIFTSSSG